MSTSRYTVTGMTCGHCVAAVTEEVLALSGVDSADVELASGRLTVTGASIADDAVLAAVVEAGYQACRA